MEAELRAALLGDAAARALAESLATKDGKVNAFWADERTRAFYTRIAEMHLRDLVASLDLPAATDDEGRAPRRLVGNEEALAGDGSSESGQPSPAPIRDSDDLRRLVEDTIRRERRRLSGKPNASERLAEAIEHRLAPLLAAHRPVREEWRVVWRDAEGEVRAIMEMREPHDEASVVALVADLNTRCEPGRAPYFAQRREVVPWQDVMDEGEGA